MGIRKWHRSDKNEISTVFMCMTGDEDASFRFETFSSDARVICSSLHSDLGVTTIYRSASRLPLSLCCCFRVWFFSPCATNFVHDTAVTMDEGWQRRLWKVEERREFSYRKGGREKKEISEKTRDANLPHPLCLHRIWEDLDAFWISSCRFYVFCCLLRCISLVQLLLAFHMVCNAFWFTFWIVTVVYLFSLRLVACAAEFVAAFHFQFFIGCVWLVSFGTCNFVVGVMELAVFCWLIGC